MKPHRRLQAVELYSRKYYEERVRSGVQTEISDRNLSRKEVLAVIKRHTQEAFEAESDEIKKEIMDELEAAKEEKEREETDGSAGPVQGPEEYAAWVPSL
jgi:hypothetical protein